MTEPSIAVAMCTYHGAEYLQEQLQSIARQTRLPDSLVVFDDDSKDHTVELLHAFAATAPFPVHVCVNPRNVGYRQNFARAIEACDADLIALADQDDFWYAHKLETIIAAFRKSPGAALVFSDADVVDDRLSPLGYTLWNSVSFRASGRASMERGRALEVLLKRNVVTGATMAFRASYRDLLLPVPETEVHDGWIALLLAGVSSLVPVPEPLIAYRQHASNQIGTRKRNVVDRLQEARVTRWDGLRRLEHQLVLVRERLRAHGGAADATDRKLGEAIDHVRTRMQLPASRARRIGTVYRELVNGRYRRCANGWSTAVRDLVI